MSIRQAIVITAVLVGIWIAGAAGQAQERSGASVNWAENLDLRKLPGITPELADRLLPARKTTPLTSRDQAREVLGLDEKSFESLRYFLYVTPPAPQ